MSLTHNPFNSGYYDQDADAIVDKLIGNAYQVVKYVALNLPKLKLISDNMIPVIAVGENIPAIVGINANLPALLALEEQLPFLVDLSESLPALNNLAANLAAVINVNENMAAVIAAPQAASDAEDARDAAQLAASQAEGEVNGLRSELSAATGATEVGYQELTTYEKLSEVSTPSDTSGTPWSWLKILRGNWTEQGGRNYFFNPDSVDVVSTLKNSVIVLGGRGDVGYRVRVGPNAELAFHGGGGDTDLDHLAGTICGGAHHKMMKNTAVVPTGSHGFIGGGSYQEVYGDYAGIGFGTLNKNYAIKAAILGGDSNRIGNTTDQTVGRNSFIGSGYLNTIDGQYAWIPSGENCKATAAHSGAYGKQAVSFMYGTVAHSGGAFTVAGDNQTHRGRLRRITTDGIATQLLLDGAALPLIMGSSTLWAGRLLINAYRTDVLETASYVLTFSAHCAAGVATIKSSNLTVLHEDNAAFNVDVIASGAQVQVRANGVAASNIRWSATFEIDEVRNI